MNLLDKFNELKKRFSQGNMSISMLKALVETTVTPEHIKAIEDQLAQKEIPEDDGGWLRKNEYQLCLLMLFVQKQPTLCICAMSETADHQNVVIRPIYKANTLDEVLAIIK